MTVGGVQTLSGLGWIHGARWGRARRRLASSPPTTLAAAASHVNVRPNCMERLASMQEIVEVMPRSISATGFERCPLAARSPSCGRGWRAVRVEPAGGCGELKRQQSMWGLQLRACERSEVAGEAIDSEALSPILALPPPAPIRSREVANPAYFSPIGTGMKSPVPFPVAESKRRMRPSAPAVASVFPSCVNARA